MTRTIPAHIEDGRVIPDAPLPEEIRSVAIVVETAETPPSIQEPADDGTTLGFARLFEMFRGVLLPEDYDVKEDYRRYLEEKYR